MEFSTNVIRVCVLAHSIHAYDSCQQSLLVPSYICQSVCVCVVYPYYEVVLEYYE